MRSPRYTNSRRHAAMFPSARTVIVNRGWTAADQAEVIAALRTSLDKALAAGDTAEMQRVSALIISAEDKLDSMR